MGIGSDACRWCQLNDSWPLIRNLVSYSAELLNDLGQVTPPLWTVLKYIFFLIGSVSAGHGG